MKHLAEEVCKIITFCICVVALALVMHGPIRGATGEQANIAQGVATGYRLDRQSAVYRDAIAAVDSTGSTSVKTNVTKFNLLGRSNVPVSARTTLAGGVTKVRCYYYFDDGTTETFLGVSDEITLTASSVQDQNSHFVAPTYVFDGMGANAVRIAVTGVPASGTTRLWAGSF